MENENICKNCKFFEIKTEFAGYCGKYKLIRNLENSCKYYENDNKSGKNKQGCKQINLA